MTQGHSTHRDNATPARSRSRGCGFRGAALVVAVVLMVAGCGFKGGSRVGGAAPADASAGGAVTVAPVEFGQVPGIAIDAEHTVGPPIVLGNLAVFPVYSRAMEDLGDFVTLDAALEAGTAAVREVGAEPRDGGAEVPEVLEQSFGRHPRRWNHRGGSGGAQVNTLEIENKGDVAILVLAGTVVKGGKQDRQIGQDFIVGKRQTVPVDAFCVEHGRWNATRNGVATNGAFKTLKVLAAGDVRAAGQYERNQGQVWSKVGEINRATGKQTASDTLTASLEDPDIAAEQTRVMDKVDTFLRSVPVADRTVGLAYAVSGQVLGARYFIHHKLFAQYQTTLIGTAVAESFTARAQARAQGKPEGAGACAAEAVAKFVAGASQGRQEEKTTSGENVNSYQFADDVYAAEARMKPARAAAPGSAPLPAPKPVTKDFLRKR